MSKRLNFAEWKDDHGMSACFPDEDVEDAFHANDDYMDELEAENKKLKIEVKYAHSYIINCIDNWNYLRDVLSSVSDVKGDELDDCFLGDFLDAKFFSESFAMTTFKEWLATEKHLYGVNSLDEHEEFKGLFWEKLNENK